MTSYNPGATVIILVRFCSHTKLSGHVFTLCISHGIVLPGPSPPDFHSQRATQFSAHRASLTYACSSICVEKASLFALRSSSLLISKKTLFTSSMFDFISSRETTSLMLALSSMSLEKSSKAFDVVRTCWFKSSSFTLLLILSLSLCSSF